MSFLASFMNLAGPDLIVILLIILVLFGAKKLPELARGMGQAVKEFQKAKDEFNDELHKAGKPEAETAKSEVKPAQSTVARRESRSSVRIRRGRASRRENACAFPKLPRNRADVFPGIFARSAFGMRCVLASLSRLLEELKLIRAPTRFTKRAIYVKIAPRL